MKSVSPSFLGRTGALAAMALGLSLSVALPVADALAKRKVPDAVKVACSTDYKRFCGAYKVGTTKLDHCMRANGKRLSPVCVRSLVDHGMVPRRLLRRARQR